MRAPGIEQRIRIVLILFCQAGNIWETDSSLHIKHLQDTSKWTVGWEDSLHSCEGLQSLKIQIWLRYWGTELNAPFVLQDEEKKVLLIIVYKTGTEVISAAFSAFRGGHRGGLTRPVRETSDTNHSHTKTLRCARFNNASSFTCHSAALNLLLLYNTTAHRDDETTSNLCC